MITTPSDFMWGILYVINIVFTILAFISVLYMWFCAFVARRILMDQYSDNEYFAVKFSGILTTFFTVSYLQHKMNKLPKISRMSEEEGKKQAAHNEALIKKGYLVS